MQGSIKYKGYHILPFTTEQRQGMQGQTAYLVGVKEFSSLEDAKAHIDKLPKNN